MSRTIITGIDIRPDRVICLIAHELEIVNKGTFLQLIGHGITEFQLIALTHLNTQRKN